uniref:Methyltransferase-related protein n=1 Tax=Fagus sylvatica TaxID=28930 RepID=A0A2N9E385_FAGSY
MCPMRFILVFFSALLAGYFAWRTVRSSPDSEIIFEDSTTVDSISTKDKQEFNFRKTIHNGFWVFVDMASGRYLWRNLRDMRNNEKIKSC